MHKMILILLLLFTGYSPLAFGLAIYTEEWPPVSFKNSNNTPDGMAVAVVRELQKRTSTPGNVAILPWARAYQYLLSEPNVLLFTVGRSAERETKMTLLGPVAISSTDVFAQTSQAAHLRGLGSAIRQLPAAAYRGSIFESTALKQGYNVNPTNDPEHSARMLMAGRVSLWIDGSIAVPGALKKLGLPISSVERIATLDTLELYLAFSKGSSRQQILAWEQALRDMKRDGSFQTIHKQWFPLSPVPMDVERLGLEP